MPRYKVSVCSETWTDYFLNAKDEEEAEEMIHNGEYDNEKENGADYHILEIEEVKE